jgi:hypothetical protein
MGLGVTTLSLTNHEPFALRPQHAWPVSTVLAPAGRHVRHAALLQTGAAGGLVSRTFSPITA